MNDESYADVDSYTEGLLKENAELERRLTMARDTLVKILNSSMDPRRIESLIEETLKQITP